jgi:hypothetical protein
MRDQQIEVAGALYLDDPVVGGDEKERGQRHRLPHDHEGVGVVGQDDEHHAGEKDVVFEGEQAGWRALPLAEVAGGERRDARRDAADDDQKERRKAIETKMERQAGQTDWQYGDLRRSERGTQGDRAENQTAGAADRKQDPRHQRQPAQGADAGDANQQPPGDHQQNPVEVHPVPHSGEQTRRHGRQRPLRHGRSNLLFSPFEQAGSESIDKDT